MKYEITKEQVEVLAEGGIITCHYMSFKAGNGAKNICKNILDKNMAPYFKIIIDRGPILTSIYCVPKGMRRKRRRRR